ncbi:MAG: serine/threonine protein kinase [Gemmataceae bacterium]|nr:serine/threonine protein kinase [Gemmataceae bacterium]
MPAPATVDDLFQLVRRSGLVEENVLSTYLRHLDPAVAALEPARLAEVLINDGLITHFQAEQFLLGKCKGMILGNYKVLERIGSGGMALVYLCEHVTMRRRVALKVLPTSNAQNAEYLKRFYREARATAGLDHPNIVRAYDVDQDENRHFLVMEYIEGALLMDLVHRFGPLPVERAAHYVSQAAIGLQHIHEAGMIHRDIKPDNLIVDRAGTVKILDLGLTRFCGDSEILTRGVLGTPDYLAPEQCLDSHRVDIRADIYGLGGTLYFLLTGSPPFPEGTLAQKLTWHQTKQPKSIRSHRPEVPAELEMIAAYMLAKNPQHRYQTPADVALALSPWTQTPIPPPSDAEMPRLSPKAQAAPDTDADLTITPMHHPGSRRSTGSKPRVASQWFAPHDPSKPHPPGS